LMSADPKAGGTERRSRPMTVAGVSHRLWIVVYEYGLTCGKGWFHSVARATGFGRGPDHAPA
jgi:hypothetical protein